MAGRIVAVVVAVAVVVVAEVVDVAAGEVFLDSTCNIY